VPAINFKKQFADLVVSGEKRQTIRPIRKRPIQRGDKLYLYTGMRTKQCRKLKETICKNIWPIIVGIDWIRFYDFCLEYSEMLDTIERDGFQRTKDFFEFFNKQYGLPFSGVLIRW
jgi:hypothetical protein